jgi:V-type H+-transporting ATPase 16kDa proteolipid subunit
MAVSSIPLHTVLIIIVKPLQSMYSAFLQLAAGLAVGFAGLAAGFALGLVGDAGVNGRVQQPKLFMGMVIIMIMAEVLAIYGLIIALLLVTKANNDATEEMSLVERCHILSLFSAVQT